MNFHLNMKASDDVCLSIKNQKNQRKNTILRQKEDTAPAD